MQPAGEVLNQDPSQRILESITDAFFAVDREWRITYINAVARRAIEPLLQSDPDALVGISFWEAVPGVAGSVFEAHYREAMESGAPQHFEAFFAPWGAWFEVHAYPLSGGLNVFFRDVSTRKFEEQRRRASLEVARILSGRTSLAETAERILPILADGVGAEVGMFWSADAARDRLDCTAAWTSRPLLEAELAAIGREVSFARGVGMPGHVWEKEAAGAFDVDSYPSVPRRAELQRLGLHACAVFPVMVHGAVVGVIELLAGRLQGNGPELLGWMGEMGYQIGQFVERTQVLEALAASESRYRDLFENASEAIYTYDLQGRFTSVNRATCEISGYSEGELLRMSIADLVSPGDLPQAQASIAARLRGEPGAPYELSVIHRSGRRIPVEVSARPLRIGTQLIGVQGVARDVSRRRRSEAAHAFLADASALLGSSLDYQETLRRVARLATQELADVCRIDILNEDGGLERLTVSAQDGALAGEVEQGPARLWPGSPMYEILQRGEGLLLKEVPAAVLESFAESQQHLELLRRARVESAMVVPLIAGDRRLGMLALVSSQPGSPYDEQDFALARALADRAAAAIENARLYREAQAATERYQALFERIPLPAWVLEPESLRFRAVNQAAIDHYGYTREEFLAMTALEIRPAEEVPEIGQYLRSLNFQQVGDGQLIRAVRHRTKQGRIIDAEVAHQVVELEGAPAIVAVVNDVTERRRMEAELRTSEQRFRGIVEHAGDALLLHDADGRIVDVNQQACDDLGFTRAELLEMSIPHLNRDLPAAELRGIWSALEPGRPITAQSIHWRKDGSTLPVEVRVGLLVDGDQKLFVALCRDVTERREAERALREREEWFRALIEDAADVVCVVSAEGIVLYESASVERALGFPVEQKLGASALDFVHPGDLPEVARRLQELAQTPEGSSTGVCRLRHRDGSWRHMEVTAKNLLAHPAVGGIVLNFHDVTEREQVQAALRQSEERFRMLAENVQAVFWITTADKSEPLYVSPGYEVVWGRSIEEMRRNWSQLPEGIHPEDAPYYLAAAHGPAAGAYDLHYRIIRPSGEVRWIRDRAFPVRDEAGAVQHIVGVAVDITDLKQTQEDLLRAKEAAEAANVAKSQFLASMSHELRTPLNSVIGFANVLRRNRAGNLQEQDLVYLDRILSNGKHLLGLINDLLDLSKIEAGKMDIELQEVRLEELVTQTLQALEGRVEGTAVELRREFPEQELRAIRTDEARLRQVLINLVGNAIKFTERGTVTVRVRAEGERAACLEVIDTGIGIPPERQEAIFHPFEQVDGTTARRFGGTGLGLAICRAICELLGYRIEVQSAPGQGSTFRVWLAS